MTELVLSSQKTRSCVHVLLITGLDVAIVVKGQVFVMREPNIRYENESDRLQYTGTLNCPHCELDTVDDSGYCYECRTIISGPLDLDQERYETHVGILAGITYTNLLRVADERDSLRCHMRSIEALLLDESVDAQTVVDGIVQVMCSVIHERLI